LADVRTKLDARQDWIERQKGGLEQVRDEALRLHRQSLEMRLLAEQLWTQISGALTPAEVTQAIAQLRLKLAEQYRLEEQQLVVRREELLKVGEAVAAQHTELEQLRAGLREWVTARQEEIERQAAALVERELSLDAQQDAHRQTEREWQAARRVYEQQIRDLSAQLRSLPLAA
jgi:chromosome segregation ATPase